MISEDMEYVQISKEKFLEMEKRLWKLDSLEAAGVDNWEGIDEAIKIMKDWVNSEAEEANIDV